MAIAYSVLLEALIKGGPGSGHFDHDGIPEHQGGSLPSYGRKKPAAPKGHPKVRRGKAKKARAAFAVPEGNESPVDDVLEAYSYDHPYLEMYVGTKPAYTDEGGWLHRLRGQRKNEIVTRLSAGTGIPYDECNAFIKQWSISSNDSDWASLTIQQIAADEFGAELTPWQKKNMADVETTRRYIIDRAIAPSQPGDPFDGKEAAWRVYSALNNAMPNVTLPFEKPALKAFMEETMNANTPLYKTEAAFRAALAKIETESRAKTRKALQFTYAETQKALKAAGISEIHLYRGSVLDASETTGMKVGEAVTVESNALSSWSFSRGVAEDFSRGYGNSLGANARRAAVVVDAVVPASRIYATAVTGPGCLTEWEMITVGSPADTVRVYSIDNKRIKKTHKAAAIIKGGPGSGHFDHDGIPEHQGGSLPSYGRKKPAEAKVRRGKLVDQMTKHPKPQGSTEIVGHQAKPAKPKAGIVGQMTPPKAGGAGPMAKPKGRVARGALVPPTAAQVDDFKLSAEFADHPIAKLFAEGEDVVIGGRLGFSYEAVTRQIGTLNRRLMEGTDLTYGEATTITQAWGRTSNDHDLRSLALQAAAAELYDQPLSAWQQEHLRLTMERRERAIRAAYKTARAEGLSPTTLVGRVAGTINAYDAFPLEAAAHRTIYDEYNAGRMSDADLDSEDKVVAWFAKTAEHSQARTKAVLSRIYDQTQAAFKAAGITHVVAYRGIQLPDAEVGTMQAGDEIEHTSNTLSSWSVSRRAVAEEFLAPSTDDRISKLSSFGLRSVVPVERILSMPRTGFGCLEEWEIVVLGSPTPDRSQVYQTRGIRSSKLKKSIKGGDGSGHFDHDGIPGHQGGSLPSKGPKGAGAAPKKLSTAEKLHAMADRLRSGSSTPEGQSVGSTTKPKLAPFTLPTTMEKPVDAALNYGDYDHPLITMLAGKLDKSKLSEDFMEDDWLEATGDSLKARVVNRLVEGAGLTYDEANDFIRQWAVSSNDSDMASLGIQAVAAKTLGTQLTPWQKEKLAALQLARRGIINNLLDDLDKPDLFTGEVDPFDAQATVEKVAWAIASDKRNVFGVFERQGLSDYVEEEQRAAAEGRPSATRSVADIRKRLDAIVKENDRKVADAVRFTYNETQAALAKAGIKEIHVYRGAALPTEALGFATSGDLTKVATNALSSWSMAYGVADDFSNNVQDDYRSTIIDTVVPASRIYSMPNTGPGCLEEWEVVVIGSKADRVRVRKNQAGRYFSPNKSWAETQAHLAALVKGGPSLNGAIRQALAAPAGRFFAGIIKGGEGSGHFGHAGIPEHQGGSLPGKGPKAKGKAKGKAKESPKGLTPFGLPTGTGTPVDDGLALDRYDHPYLEMYVGPKPAVKKKNWLFDAARQRKEEIVKRLSAATGFPADECNAFIKQWSNSANDSDMASLAIQQEAAHVFDTELSDWQKENIAGAARARKANIDQALAKGDARRFDAKDAAARVREAVLTDKSALPFEESIYDAAMNKIKATAHTEADFRKGLAAVEERCRRKTRIMLRTIYADTQKALKDAGIREVHLYRGVLLEASDMGDWKAGDAIKAQSNALSSWSFARGVAAEFASGYGSDVAVTARHRVVVVDAVVPASRIYSTAVTGQGSLEEWEMITVGSPADTVRVYSIDRKRDKKTTKSAPVKGGEGSGHFGHAGIPDHQGGSLPSKGPKAKGKAKESGDWGPGKKLPKIGDQPLADPRLVAELGVEEFTPDYAHRDHPLMRLWAAGEPVFASEHAGPDLYHGGNAGPMIKRESARIRQIAKVTGTTKADAENFLTTWLESSNNKHLGSLAIQEEAAGLWDAPLSDWQAEKLQAAKVAREKRVDQMFTLAERYHETTDDVFEQILSGFKTTELYPFEGDMRKRYAAEKKAGQVIRTREAALAWLADSEARGREATRKALAFVYQNTQAAFAEAGITHVLAYRGTSGTPEVYGKYEAGDTLAFRSNTLSSWSLSRRVVNNLFSSPGLASVSVGLEAAIPVERIVSSAVTGLGASQEWEIVVLGSADADSGHVYQVKHPPSYRKAMKGGEGSGHFGHAGRPGEQGGSLPSIEVEFDGRVWHGETHEGGTVLSKLDTGKLGEDAVIDILSQIYGVPFGTVNVKVNNAPFDVVGDHHAVEVKTGLATNGKTAQQWRATIGQPGKKETELLKNMDPAQKRAHNEWKMKAILDRKHALLDKMSADAGKPMRARTMGLIMAGDGSRADVFSFDGFHLRLPWNKHATNEHYLGTYDFKAKKMHWKNGEKPLKAAPQFIKNTTQLGATVKSLLDTLTGAGPRATPLQAAALAAIDADFARVYAWWTAHYDPATGLPRAAKTVPVWGTRTLSILPQLTKGGPGSGHFDHDGIPDHQGGSLPSYGRKQPARTAQPKAAPKKTKTQAKGKLASLVDQMTGAAKPGGGSVKLTGEVKRLAAFGLDQAMLDRATDLSADGFQAQAVVKMNGADLNIEGTWTDAAGVKIGKFNRTFKPGGEIVILEELALEKPYLGHGLGTKAAHQWFTALAEAGYTRAEMVANSTVGKYAWAKEGAQYKDPGAAAWATEAFGYWLDARGVYLDDYPVFKTPKDVAEFRHPDGVTISGETIDNSAVPAEAQVPLGKAFMLDEGGHSLWEAVIDLRQWKGKKKK